MSHRRILGVSLLFAAVGSCGGGLTHAEYVKKVNAICKAFNESNPIQQPNSIQEIPAFVDRTIPPFQEEIRKVAAIKPPSADKAKVDLILADLRAAVTQLEKLKTSIEANDQQAFNAAGAELGRLDNEVNSVSAEVGLPDCAQA
jgi:hypothetical protein